MSDLLSFLTNNFHLIALISGILVVTPFLISFGKWDTEAPWETRATTRVFTMLVFLVLVLVAVTGMMPDTSERKIEFFSGLTVSMTDLMKLMIGAVIVKFTGNGLSGSAK